MAILSFILSIITFLTAPIIPNFVAPVPEIAQDDFVPVMRFVATSDLHINTVGDTGCERLSKLLKTAYAISDADTDYQNLDAAVFAGDITDNGFIDSFAAFTAITDMELREDTERLAVLAKSHDSYTFGKNALKIYSAMTNQETDFHRVINGFHFIGVSRSKTIKQYTNAQVEWLDSELQKQLLKIPKSPFLLFSTNTLRTRSTAAAKQTVGGLTFLLTC